MADTVATYTFNNDDSYHAAIAKLQQKLGGNCYDTSYDSSYWYIYITSDCDDPSLAAQICSGYGGKPY